MVVMDVSEVIPEAKGKITNCDELKRELDGFISTLNYWQHFTGLHFTDGVKYLADRAGAYWLIDAVMSWQAEKKVKHVPFQLWTLKVLRSELGKNKNEPMAILEMNEDTGEPIIARQKIEYTDFPMGEIKLYLIDGVLLLPSEY